MPNLICMVVDADFNQADYLPVRQLPAGASVLYLDRAKLRTWNPDFHCGHDFKPEEVTPLLDALRQAFPYYQIVDVALPEETKPEGWRRQGSHTLDCFKLFKRYADEKAAYEAQYPNYCRKCNGWGVAYSQYDPSPSGVCLSHGTMTDCEPCSGCYEQGKCARCGNELEVVDDKIQPCTKCGWTEEAGGLPQQPECVCWQLEIDDEYARWEEELKNKGS